MPTFFTTFFPGWVLNAAYVVHSDEALLATGFIFLFHFFHTHLRPEAFPMDTVVFTGRMPLEALQGRAAAGVRTAGGTGQAGRVAWRRRRPRSSCGVAYVFGFTALIIGIVLAVFIFWALLGGLH